jgi:hypothetical protein
MKYFRAAHAGGDEKHDINFHWPDRNVQLQCQKYRVFFNAFQNPLRARESIQYLNFIYPCELLKKVIYKARKKEY